MSDPFRSLDQIDPPDQWDDIVDRAGHDTEVRLLDESPRRRALSRPRTWVAAAAVLALVGGGIALAAGDDPDGGVATDPSGSTSVPVPDGATTIDGGCPFTVDDAELGFPLTAGRVPVEPELGILPGPVEPTFAHGEVDDLLVEVAVGTGITNATAAGDVSGGTDSEGGWLDTFITSGTGAASPCERVVASVRLPMSAAVVEAGLDAEAVEEAYDRATPILDAVVASLTLLGGEPSDGGEEASETPTEPMGGRIEGTLDDGSPFEVWEDPGHGLSASLRDVILGCDDVGPVISPDADPSTPRLGIDGCCPPLWFGYLPEGAVDVVLDSATGERLDVEAVLGDGIWAVPVPAEHARDDGLDSDTVVTYVMEDGTEVPAPHVG